MKKAPLFAVAALVGAFFIGSPFAFASPSTIYLNSNSTIPSPFVQSTWAMISYVNPHTSSSLPDLNADYSYHTWNTAVASNSSSWCPISSGTYIADGFIYSPGNSANFHGSSTQFSDAQANADDTFQYQCVGSTWSNLSVHSGTAVISILQPVPKSVASTTAVAWSVQYYNDPLQPGDELLVSFQNAITGAWVSTTTYNGDPFSISTSSGYGVYSATSTIPEGSWTMNVQISVPPSGSPGSLRQIVYPGKLVDFSVISVAALGLESYDPAVTLSTSSSTACAFNFGFSISACAGYLFIPGSDAFQAYGNLPSQLFSRLPFSYLYSMQQTWDGLVASSTANAPVVTYDLHSLGIGSTSPFGNVLPNLNVFSSSTVEKYIPAGTWAAMKFLLVAVLWLGLFTDIFFTTRNLIRT